MNGNGWPASCRAFSATPRIASLGEVTPVEVTLSASEGTATYPPPDGRESVLWHQLRTTASALPQCPVFTVMYANGFTALLANEAAARWSRHRATKIVDPLPAE